MSCVVDEAKFDILVRQFVHSNFSSTMSLHILSTLIEMHFTLDDDSDESDELMSITRSTADYRLYLSRFIIKYVRQETELNSKFICLRTVAFYGMYLNGSNPSIVSRTSKLTWPIW